VVVNPLTLRLVGGCVGRGALLSFVPPHSTAPCHYHHCTIDHFYLSEYLFTLYFCWSRIV